MAYNDSTPSRETHYNQATRRVRSLNKAGRPIYGRSVYEYDINCVRLFIYYDIYKVKKSKEFRE